MTCRKRSVSRKPWQMLADHVLLLMMSRISTNAVLTTLEDILTHHTQSHAAAFIVLVITGSASDWVSSSASDGCVSHCACATARPVESVSLERVAAWRESSSAAHCSASERLAGRQKAAPWQRSASNNAVRSLRTKRQYTSIPCASRQGRMT